MKLTAKYGPIGDYAQTLRQEVALTAEALPGRMTIPHLHGGGDTPTAFSPDDLDAVTNAIRARFDFAPNAEIAIESDPRTLTPDMAARIGAMGFTRASFSVQEFDPRVQAAINRVQPPDLVRDSVTQLRASGVRGINFDLIYGLPLQTVDILAETVKISAAMRPHRIALIVYAHVPSMAKNQRMIRANILPNASERTAQAAAADTLIAEGYVAIDLDHFARPDDALAVDAQAGTLRRNFQGYTTDQAETMIGLGTTSIGHTNLGYVHNISEIGAWVRAIRT